MSESKCKHILYRNEKIDVGEDGWVTIENERYLVINSLRECEENFKVTKGEDFKLLLQKIYKTDSTSVDEEKSIKGSSKLKIHFSSRCFLFVLISSKDLKSSSFVTLKFSSHSLW
jgi:hypothetical protein